jgi:peptidoglycan/xylan/chitin deacetylase (PgdA/CDA1 family)
MFDLALYKTPKIIQKLFPSVIWRMEDSQKFIYLTFDDGPIPALTAEILNILKDFNAKATFFCVGENIKKYPSIFEEILAENHAVGNHTFNHLKSWKSEEKDFIDNVNLCQSETEKHHKDKKKLFRFPYGQFSRKIAKKLKKDGFDIVMWDVLSKDYNVSIPKNEILSKAIKNTSNGSIIVFHDNLKAKDKILELLPLYLKHFHDIGYKFERL